MGVQSVVKQGALNGERLRAAAPALTLDTMSANQLNTWYESMVGYRPQVDCPTMSDGELRALCKEYAAEVSAHPSPAPAITPTALFNEVLRMDGVDMVQARSALVGKVLRVYASVKTLRIPVGVFVKDIRSRYGKVDLYITDASGDGANCAWVEALALSLVNE